MSDRAIALLIHTSATHASDARDEPGVWTLLMGTPGDHSALPRFILPRGEVGERLVHDLTKHGGVGLRKR